MKADDLEALLAFVESKQKTVDCPRCHTNHWSVTGPVHALVAGDDGGRIDFAAGAYGALPLAAIICTTCGYTEFVSLVVAGVEKRPQATRPIRRRGTR